MPRTPLHHPGHGPCIADARSPLLPIVPLTRVSVRTLAACTIALMLTGVPTEPFAAAQPRVPRTADIVGRAAAARRFLATVGHWSATQQEGTFYVQFRANGSYTYTHIDPTKVIRVQQAGQYDVRTANLSDDRWPGVAAPDADARKNRGFELRLAPASIEVASSDPQGLPDDQPGDYRLTITLADDTSAASPRFTILSETLPPDSTFGRLTFTPGP